MIKIILYTSFGGDYDHYKVEERLEGLKGLKRRVEAAKLYEELSTPSSLEKLSQGPIKQTVIHNIDDRFVFMSDGQSQTITVVEVDTARPWIIANYDGMEYVQYLDYEAEEPDYNYYGCQSVRGE